MRTIIGIDPGLASTGYGVIGVEGSKLHHAGHGVIETGPSMPRGKRLVLLYEELARILSLFEPDEASVEELFFSKNVKTALPVAEARGVILLCLCRRGIPYEEYTPLVIKQSVVGRGRAEKQQVQTMVRLILGLETTPEPDHAADALAAAICHQNSTHIHRIRSGREARRV